MLLALTVTASVPAAEPPDRKPRLIVLLVVDQFRADYVDLFQHQWSGGLRRLLNDGAWFRQAAYPYFNAVTCSGHATVATGTLPRTHGLVMNKWWDRARRVETTCTEDPSVQAVSYGGAVSGFADSAASLGTATLADELRAQLAVPARTISFSLKARSAIPLGGHRPSAIAWFDDSGTWVTSTAFSPGPVREVASYIQRHPVENEFGRVWTRTLPVGSYLFEHPAVGAASTVTTADFPHALGGGAASPDPLFYWRWQSSPFADDYLASMALDVAGQLRLGQGDTTDVVAVGFSVLDKVGHDFGPNSHEIQDVLVRLDRTLATLFAGLDRMVGAGQYVVALTSDHGVAPIPERALAQGLDAGRVAKATLVGAIDAALQRTLGAGRYVARMVSSDVYLEPGAFDRMRASPAATAAVRSALEAVPGVARVLTRDQIIDNRFEDDPLGRQVANSFDRERSGDVVVLLKPYWLTDDSASPTSHGAPYAYDVRVPLFLMGRGIVSGEYLAAASPADVAPTLAFLAGVTLSHAEGRVLVEALTSASPRPAAAPAPARESARR
jgi:predicted AlkP superfamily pyrophosphatase or phosphodiesterase